MLSITDEIIELKKQGKILIDKIEKLERIREGLSREFYNANEEQRQEILKKIKKVETSLEMLSKEIDVYKTKTEKLKKKFVN